MNMCTLIIDGNWLLMSRLGMMMTQFKTDNNKEILDNASDELVEFMAQSINKTLHIWDGIIDNFIIVQDGGSWRKSIKIPECNVNVNYKGNRKATEELDWKYIWKSIDDIVENLNISGVTCSKSYNIEGDDWCWYWSRELNNNNCNVIIWSSDADLKQLVCKNEKTGCWTAWYNKNTVVFSEDFKDRDFIDELVDYQLENPLIQLIKTKPFDISYINPNDIIMMKTICGDGSDNIKPIFRIEYKGRTYGVTERMWNSTKEKLKITNMDQFLRLKSEIIYDLFNNKRFRGYDINTNDASDMFDYNLNLVWLDLTQIPKDIIQAMQSKHDYHICEMSYFMNNYKTMTNQNRTQVMDLFDSL